MSTSLQLTGRLVDQDADDYHADATRISRSQLVDFMESPLLFKRRHLDRDPHWQQEPTKALDFGTACHQAILVDRDATKAFRVIPEDVLNDQGHRKGAAWTKWKQENEGHMLLTAAEAADWIEMWNSIQEHENAFKLLAGNFPGSREEQSVHWSWESVDMRCRIDRITPFALVDLKTAASVEEHILVREIASRKLYVQAAMYQWAWECATGETLPFMFVFVEKSAPYRTVCRQLEPAWIELGNREVMAALTELQLCADRDYWPRQRDTSVVEIPLPAYLTKQDA